jgi:hypothetical protein
LAGSVHISDCGDADMQTDVTSSMMKREASNDWQSSRYSTTALRPTQRRTDDHPLRRNLNALEPSPPQPPSSAPIDTEVNLNPQGLVLKHVARCVTAVIASYLSADKQVSYNLRGGCSYAVGLLFRRSMATPRQRLPTS